MKTQAKLYGGDSNLNRPRPSAPDRGRSLHSSEQARNKITSGKIKNRREHSLGQKAEGSGWTSSTKPNALTESHASKPMTRDEFLVTRDAEDEFKRRGHFKRVFPSLEYNYYKQFFINGERPANKLLDERIMAKRRMKTAALI